MEAKSRRPRRPLPSFQSHRPQIRCSFAPSLNRKATSFRKRLERMFHALTENARLSSVHSSWGYLQAPPRSGSSSQGRDAPAHFVQASVARRQTLSPATNKPAHGRYRVGRNHRYARSHTWSHLGMRGLLPMQWPTKFDRPKEKAMTAKHSVERKCLPMPRVHQSQTADLAAKGKYEARELFRSRNCV